MPARPPVPERIELGGGVRLERWRRDDGEALARATRESLDHLRPWLPWATDAERGPGAFRPFLDRAVDGWDAGREHHFAIRAGDDLVGGCDVHERIDGAHELGYWIHVDRTGRGHVTAAAAVLVDVARGRGARTIVIRCDEGNTRSAAVARRLGFRLRRLEPHGIDAPAQTGTFQVWALDVDPTGPTDAAAPADGPSGDGLR